MFNGFHYALIKREIEEMFTLRYIPHDVCDVEKVASRDKAISVHIESAKQNLRKKFKKRV